METQAIVFWVFSAIAVVSAAGVVLNFRNTVNAALSLVVTMLALAVLFVGLHAEFIGVLQVLVYAGAIVVLFLFVIMLLNLRGGSMGADSQPFMKLLGAALVLLATSQLAGLLRYGQPGWAEITPEFGQVRDVGLVLFTDYLLVFELAGVLLTAGVVGAVVLAKRSLD